MWEKMSQIQIEELLERQIKNYKRERMMEFSGASIVMLGFSILLAFSVFSPSKVMPWLHMPSSIEMILRIVVIFGLFESFVAVVILFMLRKFNLLSHDAKRLYFIEINKRKAKKSALSATLFMKCLSSIAENVVKFLI